MTYQEFINNILQTRGRFMDGNEYHERHHIIPRCKNGSNDESNLIDLFAKEHFIAHKLLAEENMDDDQLVHAYMLMAFVKDGNQKRYELTPEEYEEARKIHSKRFSGANNPFSKQVIRLYDDKVYGTVRACYIDNNISSTTMYDMLKKHRNFMYYNEWINMSEREQREIKSIDWDAIQHENRSQAAKKAGNGGSIKHSQATREKISSAHKGKYGINVYCPELDETFTTIKEASVKYNVNKTSIGYCLCGKQKHAGKHPVTGEKLSWVKLENKIS
jgi:hypothetical protein